MDFTEKEIQGAGTDAGVEEQTAQPVGHEQLMEFTRILNRYKGGTSRTRDRIISSENWWKLRNTEEARKETAMASQHGFHSRSAWLHNVITSKHADAM